MTWLIRVLFAPVGWWLDLRYARYHDRLSGDE